MSTREPDKDTARIDALSDGVFAIAITLLALEIKVPHLEHAAPSNADLISALLAHWPSYLSYVVSFLAVLIMWTHHHALMKRVRRADGHMRMANGVFLMAITLVPWPTSMLAEYMRTPAMQTAVVVYSGYFLLVNLTFNWMAHAALRQGVSLGGNASVAIRRFRTGYRAGFVGYLGALVLAFLAPTLALSIVSAMWLYWGAVTFKDNHDADETYV